MLTLFLSVEVTANPSHIGASSSIPSPVSQIENIRVSIADEHPVLVTMCSGKTATRGEKKRLKNDADTCKRPGGPPSSWEYERSRRFMSNDTASLINGSTSGRISQFSAISISRMPFGGSGSVEVWSESQDRLRFMRPESIIDGEQLVEILKGPMCRDVMRMTFHFTKILDLI
jgi:hypothetical protein